MILRTKLELAGAALAITLAFCGWRTWLGEHDARIRAQSQAAAAQQDFQSAAARIADLKKQDAARASETQKEIAAIARSAAEQRTPQQIARWIPSQVPLPAPISISPVPAAGKAPQVSLPAADLPALKDFIVRAKTCAVELPEARSELSSCQAQANLAAQQLADVEKERDAYKLALKGGTFWHRLKSGAKKIAIGAAIGAAAVCASGHCK